MLRYRAATFFGRLYAPELLMGMETTDEIEDAVYTEIPEKPRVSLHRTTQPLTPSEKAQEAPQSKEVVEGEETPVETPKIPVESSEAPESGHDEAKPVKTKMKSEKPKTETPVTPEAQEDQLFRIDGVEVVNPPKYDFVDAEEIIMFLETSESLEDFKIKSDKIKLSYNKLSQSEKNKVIDAAEIMKKTLEEGR